MVTPNRFPTVNWVPRKIEVPLLVPYKELSLDAYLGRGKQAGEEDLPDTAEGSPSLSLRHVVLNQTDTTGRAEPAAGPAFNADAMNQLVGMGFPEIRAQRALLATGNSDAETAMNWLFAHMEDPGSSPFPCGPT
jgi:ubiquitin carboxyl-terminal hydrolase 5/13